MVPEKLECREGEEEKGRRRWRGMGMMKGKVER